MLILIRCLTVNDSSSVSSKNDELLYLYVSSVNPSIHDLISEFCILRPYAQIQRILFAGQEIAFKQPDLLHTTLASFNIVKECTVHFMVKSVSLYGLALSTGREREATENNKYSLNNADSDELPLSITPISPSSPHSYRPFFIRQPTEEEVQYGDIIIIKLQQLKFMKILDYKKYYKTATETSKRLEIYFELSLGGYSLRSPGINLALFDTSTIHNTQTDTVRAQLMLFDELFVFHVDLSPAHSFEELSSGKQIHVQCFHRSQSINHNSVGSKFKAFSPFGNSNSNSSLETFSNTDMSQFTLECSQIPRDQTLAIIKKCSLPLYRNNTNNSNSNIEFEYQLLIDRSSITSPEMRGLVLRLFHSHNSVRPDSLYNISPGLTVSMLLGKEIFRVNNKHNKLSQTFNSSSNSSQYSTLLQSRYLSSVPALHHLYYLLSRSKLKIQNHRTARKVSKILISSQAIQTYSELNYTRNNIINNISHTSSPVPNVNIIQEQLPTRCVWVEKYNINEYNTTFIEFINWLYNTFPHRIKQIITLPQVQIQNQTHFTVIISFKLIEDSILFLLELANYWNPLAYSANFIVSSANLYAQKLQILETEFINYSTALLQYKVNSKDNSFITATRVWCAINQSNFKYNPISNNNSVSSTISNNDEMKLSDCYYFHIWSTPSWNNPLNLLYSIPLHKSTCLIMKDTANSTTIEILLKQSIHKDNTANPSIYLTFSHDLQAQYWIHLLKEYRMLSVSTGSKLQNQNNNNAENSSNNSIIAIKCNECKITRSLAYYYIRDSISQVSLNLNNPAGKYEINEISQCFNCIKASLLKQTQIIFDSLNNITSAQISVLKSLLCEYSLQDLQDLLSIKQYSQLTGFITQAHIENKFQPTNITDNTLEYSACPSCGCYLQLQISTVSTRYYCYRCSHDFCNLCFNVPFHMNRSCEQFKQFQSAKKCRFCGEIIGEQSIGDYCDNDECIARNNISCRKNHIDCKHPCLGLIGETHCPPCLYPQCVSKSPNPLSSTSSSSYFDLDLNSESLCNICYIEPLICSPIITLKCDHIFHYDCLLKRVIGDNKKDNSHTVNLNRLKCPLCQQLIESKYPYKPLQDILDPLIQQFQQCKVLAIKQILQESNNSLSSSNVTDSQLWEAVNIYSFFVCAKCSKPYFAGRKVCEVVLPANNTLEGKTEQQEEKDNNITKNDADDHHICSDCLPPVNESSPCSIHGSNYLVFKCRFCCSIATNFCFDRVHFCSSCHGGTVWHQLCSTTGRNKKLIHQYKQCPPLLPSIYSIATQYNDETERLKHYEKLFCTAEECDLCPLGIRHPPNGFEFGLGCSQCKAGKS